MSGNELTRDQQLVILHTARESIEARVEGRAPVYDQGAAEIDALCGAFVTIHRKGALRGCIGHMVGTKPLFQTIRELAVASGFQDPRFPPLSADEYPEIDIEVSVLSPLRKIERVDEIEVGTHGIYITKNRQSGVLLPQVAVEQGWDRNTFLTHGCYKAGLPGNAWRDPDVEIEIFSAQVFGE